MRTTLLIILTLVIATALHARDLKWHHGSIVLSDREVVTGEIARLSFDLLLHRNATGEVTTYPAHKVSSFRYYDQANDINRIFVSVAQHKTYKYYERVVTGKISVFRIQEVFDQNIDETNPDSFNFFIEKERIVCSMKKFRQKFFAELKRELDHQLVSYNGLDPNTRLGALSIILLYNQTATSSVASLN
jgi:hypothetical protein